MDKKYAYPIFVRITINSILSIMGFSVVKRISIVCQAIATVIITPATIVVSYFMTREIPLRKDLVSGSLLILSTILIITGYTAESEDDNGYIAIAWMIVCPLLVSYGTIVTKRMKDMNPLALPIYL